MKVMYNVAAAPTMRAIGRYTIHVLFLSEREDAE